MLINNEMFFHKKKVMKLCFSYKITIISELQQLPNSFLIHKNNYYSTSGQTGTLIHVFYSTEVYKL
jgi:hypothetical protein